MIESSSDLKSLGGGWSLSCRNLYDVESRYGAPVRIFEGLYMKWSRARRESSSLKLPGRECLVNLPGVNDSS